MNLATPASRYVLIAALAGLVAVAGFAPVGFGPLPILALAALMLLWQRTDSASTAALTGFAFGLAHFGAGVSWVYVSLHDFGMMPAPIAALATLLFCTILALYPAVTGYLQKRLQLHSPSRPAITLMIIIPALWALTEWLRGWVFTGFPWLALGYSQTDTPLAGLAPVAGVFGISFAAALAAGLLAFIVSGGVTRTARLAAIAGLVILLGGGWWLRTIAWTTPAGSPVSVALAQGNVPQSLKFEEARYATTLATYRRMAEQSTAQLTVFPETAIPRFLDMVDPEYLASLASTAKARNGDVLLGAPLREAGGVYTNSVVSIGASPTQTYSKVHLVPFGEFIPPGFGWVLAVLRIPLSDFTRGRTEQQPLVLGAGLRVALNICYEDAFGDEIARQLPAATLLVNVSNVAWFGDSLAPDQHLQISRLRAMETGRPMLRATNTGVTAIIDERGQVVARLPSYTEGLLEGRVQPFEGATPFVRLGNGPIIVLCIVLLIGCALVARRRTAQKSA